MPVYLLMWYLITFLKTREDTPGHQSFCMESLNEAAGENKKHRTSKNKKDKPRPDNGSNKENNPKVKDKAVSTRIFKTNLYSRLSLLLLVEEPHVKVNVPLK